VRTQSPVIESFRDDHVVEQLAAAPDEGLAFGSCGRATCDQPIEPGRILKSRVECLGQHF